MSESRPAEPRETARLEAFSDGVIAIAITLLIIEIGVPHVEEGESLLDGLLALWPSYLAYLISFSMILIMWVNHHLLFTIIRRVDNTFLLLNGFLLMLITFVNFPTAVLAEYVLSPQRQVAALFYSGTFMVKGLTWNGVWWYASRGSRLLDQAADPALVGRITRIYRLALVLYAAAFLSAFLNVWVSLAIIGGLAIFFCFTGVGARKAVDE